MNKEELLNTGYFKNNNFLEKYLDLFNEIPEDNFEGHHILPKAFFKIKKIKIDNSKKNLRNLSFENHYLAHYYLTKCTSGALKKVMNYYFSRMNMKIAFVAFELNANVYKQIRMNDKQNYRNYITAAHNNIANYNKVHPQRTPEHIQHMKEGMKRYWKRRKMEELT
jgi:hypothetical protein